MERMRHHELSEKVIAAAYRVHNELGYGFMEKAYKNAMPIELGEAGVRCSCEVPLKVLYHGKVVGDYCADMVVEDKIVVEAQAVSKLDSIHEVQLVNYLKATGLNVGLLINFGRSVEVKRRVFDSPPKTDETRTNIVKIRVNLC
jgi:GxxExxY protein